MQPSEDKRPPHSTAERAFALWSLLMVGSPTDAGAIPPIRTAPSGLRLVYSAPTASEAEWLRQMLLQSGFHVEFVPSITSGIFGTTGSVDVYVEAEQAEDAIEFLGELARGTGEAPHTDIRP